MFRLGFVVNLAKQVAERLDPVDSPRVLWLSQLERDLSASRLLREETLCPESPSAREREWLRENRPEEAVYWNLLTKWRLEHLRYAAAGVATHIIGGVEGLLRRCWTKLLIKSLH